jgi:hypothetical protein
MFPNNYDPYISTYLTGTSSRTVYQVQQEIEH